MDPDLFGRTVADISIEIMREFEPPEGYWLAFSGGKDSVCLLHLAKVAGVKYEAHYNLTTCDPPELVQFIKKQYPEVAVDRPEMSMWKLIEERGYPTRRARHCCSILKERSGIGHFILTGIRSAESHKRRKRRVVELCFRDPSTKYVNPMKHWTENDVWSYIRSEGIPYCGLYDEGWRRLGCVICPMEMKVERSMERWPKIWEAARRAFYRRYQKSEACQKNWATAEEMWMWWIERDRKHPKNMDTDGQMMMFDGGD